MKVISSAKLKTEIKEQLVKVNSNVTFLFFSNIDEAKEDLADADVFITYGEDLSAELIERAVGLKWIMVMSAGLDQLPSQSIKDKGIIVTNAKGIHKVPMAEYTIAMMLQVAKEVKQLIKNEQNQVWDRRVSVMELNRKTIGILGTGSIGAEIAKCVKVFDMKTMGFNRSGRKVNHFDEIVSEKTIGLLLKESDFIVSVLPHTKETNKIINQDWFNQMNDVIFINIGRGKTVVEEDLLSALSNGNIRHAVLDVFDEEPLPKNHPFWTNENVTVTPHLSGITSQYQYRAIEIFQKNITKLLAGQSDLLNIIDIDKGY